MPYSYRSLTRALADAGIEEADQEACLLLERYTGATRAALLCDRDRLYDDSALDTAVARRLTRYPLQYILGAWDFCGCRFTVNEHCLIPRPDTEILVEEAIRTLPTGARVLDLCTGSGCIAVSLLRHRPDVSAVALELYPETLALATQNACDNGVADRFTPLCADLLAGIPDDLRAGAPYDAILSNPPYIRRADLAGLSPEVHCEPEPALDGGEDGLTFYRTILCDYAPLVKTHGFLLLEIGHDQAADLLALAVQDCPAATVRILRDLGGNERVAVLQL